MLLTSRSLEIKRFNHEDIRRHHRKSKRGQVVGDQELDGMLDARRFAHINATIIDTATGIAA